MTDEEAEDRRRRWDVIHTREQARKQNITHFKKAIEEASGAKKTPKSLLKLVIHSGGIRSGEASEVLGVSRANIDLWVRALEKKNLVEIESRKHPNPTIRPTHAVISKVRRFQDKNKELIKERKVRTDLETELDNRAKRMEGLEAELKRERLLRSQLEEKLILTDERLRADEEDFLDQTTDDIMSDIQEGEVFLDSGSTYLLLEERPDKSVKLFQKGLEDGSKGMYITRSNPRKVRDRHDLGDTTICWLTNVQADGDIISVSGLQDLSILVSNFIDENEGSVILLDGLEYLVSNNDFPIVLRLVQQIRDKVSTSESKMLIPLNPKALDSKQLTLLERECQTIR
ncbi:MAG: DUF835 domain-containing protein [Candidatus Altiarchaeales archaeon]|nr:DUF835 domain-containing protein [Candidatus Altiarchaeales archaeon]MBD3417195.1 DUF835 domain-containing protein [Candidatus Altiarchaeales archaeon]